MQPPAPGSALLDWEADFDEGRGGAGTLRRATGGSFWRDVPALFNAGAAAGLTDGQLLERFATRRGDAAERAFAALVERHGPMVLRTCRAVLGDEHEALDAFQTTFLALAKRGRSLWVRDSLGPWLHRVARRASGRARNAASRRRDLERRAAEAAAPSASPDADLIAAIQEEVDRLPERYRVPLVLCDLGGQTCEDVARHLGRPVGTVKSWRARGRARLRDRLLRRGLAPAAAWPFAPEIAAPVSTALADATAGLAAQSLATGAFPAAVSALVRTEWVDMVTLKLKWIAVALAAGLTAAGAGVLARQEPTPTGRPEAAKTKPKATDDPANPPAKADGLAVPVVRPVTKRVADFGDFTGRLDALSHVEIRPRVSGAVVKVNAREGEAVQKGSVLFEIDPEPFQEAVKRAAAEEEKARATLDFRERVLKRYKDLAQRAAVPESVVDEREAEVVAARPAAQAAEAELARAKAKLDLTRVTAPIAGKVGPILQGVGSVVAADVTPMTTVTTADPLLVFFGIDERTYLRNARLKQAGKPGFLEPETTVRVGLADEDGFPRVGKVDSVGDRVNPGTGTILVRATLANPDGVLLPGIFARVRLTTGEPHQALLVPWKAVVTDQGMRYLYVVSDRNVAHRLVDGKDIGFGSVYDGLVEITEGFLGSELVVVAPSKVEPGATIRPEVVPAPSGDDQGVPGRPK